MVAVQDYCLGHPDEVVNRDSAYLDELRQERSLLLDELGFRTLSSIERVGGVADQFDTAKTLYPEMRGKVIISWKRFLPTIRSPQEYSYDSVPTEALELIKTAKQLGCFKEIVIWTPE